MMKSDDPKKESAGPESDAGSGLTDVQMDALKMRLTSWLFGRVAGFLAVAGAVLVFIFNQIAENTAERGVTRGVVRELNQDPKFIALVDERAALPVGTIIAINDDRCPPGPWQPFAHGAGRVIVGAGSGNKDALGHPLTERRWSGGSRTTGGLEAVQLTEPQMPAHDHAFNDPGHSHYVKWGQEPSVPGPSVLERSKRENPIEDRARTPSTHPGKTGIRFDPQGGSAPHENMPPFIVLTVCERVLEADDQP